MVIVLLLAASKALALLLRQTNRKSAAVWVLSLSMLLACGIVATITAFAMAAEFAPASYEDSQIRHEKVLSHLCVLLTEFALLLFVVFSVLSGSPRSEFWFWWGWGVNLAVIGLMVYVECFHCRLSVEACKELLGISFP
jgi:hypothetical protein